MTTTTVDVERVCLGLLAARDDLPLVVTLGTSSIATSAAEDRVLGQWTVHLCPQPRGVVIRAFGMWDRHERCHEQLAPPRTVPAGGDFAAALLTAVHDAAGLIAASRAEEHRRVNA